MPVAEANAATPSGGFKVVLPQIEAEGIAWTGGIAPKSARLKFHGIKRLRIFPLELGIGVGEHMRAMRGEDYALFVARVAWQPRVSERMDVCLLYTSDAADE